MAMSVEYAEHQKRAIAFQQMQPYSLCCCATGTGKTVITIGSELVNLQQNKLDKCIFCCTKASIGEVLNDYKKFYDFEPIQLNSYDAIRRFFESTSTVAVTRYEWLKYFEQKYLVEQSAKHKIGIWFDEAQKVKNLNTKAHKFAAMLRRYCYAFHLVTATPVMSSLDDLYWLVTLLDPRIFGDYNQFANDFYVRILVPHPTVRRRRKTCPTCGAMLRFSETTGRDYCTNLACKSIETPQGFIPYSTKVKCLWELVEYKNLDILSQRLQKVVFCFFPKQDIQYHQHVFELKEDTEKTYFAIAKDLLNETMKETEFTARMNELQYVVDRSYEKRAELFKLAQQLKHKGFVLYVPLYQTSGKYNEHNTLDYVQKVLDAVPDLEYKAYTGKETDDERDENKKWFQENPKNKCLIISRAGGASLNLQVTNEFIFYSIGNGFGEMSQALGRVVRMFSSYKTFNIHFIIGEHAIDRYKYTVFLMYREIMEKLFNNQLISSNEFIKFNSQIKAEMRKDLLWRVS